QSAGRAGRQPAVLRRDRGQPRRRTRHPRSVGRQGGEGAKFWMAVLTDLRNRGVKDSFFVVCDGLKGLPEVVSNGCPAAVVQTCIIHLIRNTFRLTSRKYWDELKRDLKPVYTAVNATRGAGGVRRAGRQVGRPVSGRGAVVEQRLAGVHPVPGLR